MRGSSLPVLAIACTLSACAEGTGTLDVRIYGEPFIEDQIPTDVFIDGWSVEFSTFVIAVDAIAADGEPEAARRAFDLTESSDGDGHEVTTLEVDEGAQQLAYRVAPGGVASGGNAATADAAALESMGASMWVEGTAVRGDETIAFSWWFTTDTSYRECEVVEAVAEGGSATTMITVHADHLFYDDLDSPEPNVAFDLIAASDADADGNVTAEELAARDITSEARYQVGSRDVTNLWDFIQAQTTTVGHIDGEGHCAT